MSDDPIIRAKRAEQLLQEPLIVEAFEEMRATFTQAWEATAENETEKRDRLWLMLKLTDRVKGHLETVMADGKLAQRRIDEIEQPKRRFFR